MVGNATQAPQSFYFTTDLVLDGSIFGFFLKSWCQLMFILSNHDYRKRLLKRWANGIYEA